MSFTVYKSSAGSGKTSTLVKEYLKIVLDNPAKFRNILAITFTNKAAAEMKERIITALSDLTEQPINIESKTYKYLLPELTKQTKLDEQAIIERAEKVLKLILHNYSDFGISTIDSFVYRIVRTFAHDLHIPMNFDVELETDELIEQSVDLLLSNVGIEEKLTKVLVDFTESKTDIEKNWHIESDLQEIALLLLNEDGQLHLEKIKELTFDDFLNIRDKISEIIKIFENKISGFAAEADDLIKKNNLPHSAFTRADKGISKYFEKLKNKFYDSIQPNSFVISTIEEDKWYSGKASVSEKSAIDSIKSMLSDCYNKIQELISAQYQQYKLMLLINKNLYPVAVLNEIRKLLNEIKTESNIVHISEFNNKIAEIVLNEPVPFIYERLGERYKHFLIDEFQDTSILQWQNLLPLIENSLAENNFNMVVGDGKQAIYRWRNGEVEQFDKLPNLIQKQKDEILQERENALKNHYKEETLDTNFRSKAEIVDFNNTFFYTINGAIPQEYQSIYHHAEQKFNEKNKGGYIHISFSDKNFKTQELLEEHCSKIEILIQELLQQNFQLKDIAILCRKNNIASKIAAFLIERNIDVVSSESLLLGNSPVVKFIYSIIRFINNPLDDIAKVEIINFLVKTNRIMSVGLHEDFKDAIARNDKDSEKKFLYFLQKYGFNLPLEELLNLPVYDLCEKLVRMFSLNIPANPDIEFFMDAVFSYSGKHGINIADFIEWWEKQKDKKSIVVPEELNAVKIMTIHKAKGLEFPVVIYPMATETVRRTKNITWVDLEEAALPELKTFLLPLQNSLQDKKFADLQTEENSKSFLDLVNLLYVVMTRPSERLYILSQSSENIDKEPKSISDLLIYYLQKTNQWIENKTIYESGMENPFQTKESSEKSNNIKFELKNFISTEWKEKILLRTKAHEAWDIENPRQINEWGILVHKTLSKIKTFRDVDFILEKIFFEGIVNEEEKEKLSGKINELLSNPMIKIFFEEGLNIKCEQEILTREGKIFRPDRVILYDDRIVVIDYKTGTPDEVHKNQIAQYADLLQEIGYKNIEKKLIYIDENKIIDVDN